MDRLYEKFMDAFKAGLPILPAMQARCTRSDGLNIEGVTPEGLVLRSADGGESWTLELRSDEPRRHPRDPGINPETVAALRRIRDE